MKARLIIVGFSSMCILFYIAVNRFHATSEIEVKDTQPEITTMTNSAIISDIDSFINQQNKNRGGSLPGGGYLPLDYDALTTAVPTGGNAVTGISGIAASSAPIMLPSTQIGNAVIIDGGVSTTASTSGADSYSFFVATNGTVTMTDNNTGNSETITGASYLVFDGAATTSTGAYQSDYLIETGVNAQIASLYNAAFGRVPDFPGLEYYAIPIANGAISLHQAAANFLASPEFQTDFPSAALAADDGGAHDQAFITALYQNILHRTPNSTEMAYYVSDLQGTLPGIAQQDRAQLLINFAVSAENQTDIAASNGGWLINPASGAVSLGALTTASAQTLLTSEISSGTINADSFATLPASSTISTSGYTITDAISVNGTIVYGINNPTYNGNSILGGLILVSASHITIDLSTQYNKAMMEANNLTVNGVPTGGSLIITGSNVGMDNGGIVNLSGNYNIIAAGNFWSGNINNPTIINSCNSTDIITEGNSSPFATGTIYSGSSVSPVSGATIAAANFNQGFQTGVVAINVGSIANDSTSTMVAAANAAYKVADASAEHAFFFGQDPQGNTMVFFWRGDTTHAGTVLALDMTGAIELVGVQASTLTGANFHS